MLASVGLLDGSPTVKVCDINIIKSPSQLPIPVLRHSGGAERAPSAAASKMMQNISHI